MSGCRGIPARKNPQISVQSVYGKGHIGRIGWIRGGILERSGLSSKFAQQTNYLLPILPGLAFDLNASASSLRNLVDVEHHARKDLSDRLFDLRRFWASFAVAAGYRLQILGYDGFSRVPLMTRILRMMATRLRQAGPWTRTHFGLKFVLTGQRVRNLPRN